MEEINGKTYVDGVREDGPLGMTSIDLYKTKFNAECLFTPRVVNVESIQNILDKTFHISNHSGNLIQNY